MADAITFILCVDGNMEFSRVVAVVIVLEQRRDVLCEVFSFFKSMNVSRCERTKTFMEDK